jgi:hypothetical protein
MHDYMDGTTGLGRALKLPPQLYRHHMLPRVLPGIREGGDELLFVTNLQV